MKGIIALEGIGGSGKTTLINELIKRGFAHIPEISLELKEEFPHYSIELNEALRANRWFLEQEIERCKEALSLAKDRPVVADRWYHSIFAVSYARNKLHGTQDGEILKRETQVLLDAGKIFEPIIVVLDVPLEISLQRLEKRYGNKSFMEDFKIASPDMLREEQVYYRNIGEKRDTLIDGRTDVGLMADRVELIYRKNI